MIPNKIGTHYAIRPKSLEKKLDNGGWDKLLRRHQGNVNNHRIMDLRNIDSKLFATKVNFQPMRENSQSLTIGKFRATIGRILAIEPTSDSEDLGKYIFIVNNKDYEYAKMKFDDVLKYVYEEKDTLATMKSSHERFGAYPEVNGGSPVDGTLNDTIATLNAELAEQAKKHHQHQLQHTKYHVKDYLSGVMMNYRRRYQQHKPQRM